MQAKAEGTASPSGIGDPMDVSVSPPRGPTLGQPPLERTIPETGFMGTVNEEEVYVPKAPAL